jgi:hypothetical protein
MWGYVDVQMFYKIKKAHIQHINLLPYPFIFRLLSRYRINDIILGDDLDFALIFYQNSNIILVDH